MTEDTGFKSQLKESMTVIIQEKEINNSIKLKTVVLGIVLIPLNPVDKGSMKYDLNKDQLILNAFMALK